MLKQENVIKIRNRGVATMAGLSTIMAGSATAVAENSVQKGANKSTATDNQVSLFADDGVFQRVVNMLLFLVGAISVIMLIVGGIRYILSSGDQAQVTSAKNTIMYAIIGIIVAVLAWGIVNFLLGWLIEGTSAIE